MTSYVTDTGRPDLGGNIRHGDACTYCPNLWDYLIGRFAVRSVLDVGCGEGHAVRYFARRGVAAHGIDGLVANVVRSVYPIALHDILERPYIMPVDLVWSCEVAEHIVPESVDNYVATLTNGTIVAMTHANPGQPGHHHVNCQTPDYWISAMTQKGYTLDPLWLAYREIQEVGFSHFQRSGLVFVRDR